MVRLTPVVSDDPTYPGARGLVGTVAAKADDWSGVRQWSAAHWKWSGTPFRSLRR